MSDTIDERRSLEPDRPWLWNPEWAQGRVLPHEKPGTLTGAIAGYWVVAIVILGTFHLIPRAAPPGEPFWPVRAVLWGLALLLGTFGVVALYLAVKRTRSARRFGEVWLALEENPSILGGKLCAAVHAANGAIPVEFDLPEDLPESDPDITSRAKWCTWDLVVTVASTTATYHGQFAVPVFKRDTVARTRRND